MRVLILHRCCGSEDGFVLRLFERGNIVWLRSGLACRLIASGRALRLA